ncbi:MAG: hypothetical protein U0X91_20030 [Spirosomataceae bacterium]
MNRQPNFRPRFLFFPLMAAAAVLLMGAVVRFLWNAILPALIGVSVISYWQAVGLLVLCRILFGNFGRGGMGRPPRWESKRGFQGGQWRNKWADMTEEEREKLKEEWRRRCQK